MIDLHCHILPGVDDGATDAVTAIDMARIAVEDGVHTIAATPHVNHKYPVDAVTIEDGVTRLNADLAEHDVPLSVVRGAELAATSVLDMDEVELRRLTLGGGDCLLIESPYVSEVPFFERLVFDLQLRGFRPMLAHPERSPMFQRDPRRLAGLVERGVLCSITAGSMSGAFGATVRRFTLALFRDGLVHDVASDAHDSSRRPPGLRSAFLDVESDLPGLAGQLPWFAAESPSAILSGRPLPPRPRTLSPRQSGWRRLLRTSQ